MTKSPRAARRAILTTALSGVVAVLLLVVLAQSGSAHNNPYRTYGNSVSVSVSQSTVTAGADVNVSGSGFASRSDVSLTLHSRSFDLDQVRADRNGTFSTSVTIPSDTTPGTHEIVASGRASDGSRSSATVTITVQPGRQRRHHHSRRGN